MIDIFWCKNCLNMSTRPRIEFDKNGWCNACQWMEEKKIIDWKSRQKELKSIIKKFGKINSFVLFLCFLLLVLELIGHRHGETNIEDLMFFPAFFGFLSCMIIFKIGVSLRSFLMKDEDYYDR